MATTPQFADTPIIKLGQVTTANTNYDGSGTTVDVVDEAENVRINSIRCVGAGTVSGATMVRAFINDGTNSRLFDEFEIAATTPSATVKNAAVEHFYDNLVVPSTHKILFSVHGTENINILAFGGQID
jgi:hypothetical protein